MWCTTLIRSSNSLLYVQPANIVHVYKCSSQNHSTITLMPHSGYSVQSLSLPVNGQLRIIVRMLHWMTTRGYLPCSPLLHRPGNGTGFLSTHDNNIVLCTSNHVLMDKETALSAEIVFDLDDSMQKAKSITGAKLFDMETAFHHSPVRRLLQVHYKL